MEIIKFNESGLKAKDITKVVTRVKVLLIDDDIIHLGYSNNQYQFIGGHLDYGDEPLIEALNREITEETGMELNLENQEPYLKFVQYSKNHPSFGENQKTILYYFVVKGNFKINLDNTNYTEKELAYNFEVRQVPLLEFENEIRSNNWLHKNAVHIGKEMINAYNIYKHKYEGVEIRDLYDSSRNYTGLVVKKGDVIPHELHYLTVAVFITNSKGEFLIQKRSIEKDGTYGITGGHPTHGMNSIEGLLEEVKEELGLILDESNVNLVKTLCTHDDFFDLYHVEKDVNLDNVILQPEEVESVSWMSMDDINKLIEDGKFNKGHDDLFKYYFEYRKNI